MKNFVDLKNYLIKEIKPQENYQYFIFKELINSGGQVSYDELAKRYDAEFENTYKTNTKTIFRDTPTKVLTKHGYITSDNNNVYANFNEEPLYYKETISWILEKCLDHWTKNKSIKGLEFREGIIKTDKEIEKFCNENNTPRDLVENILLSINRGEKQIILDGPPGTGKTYLIKKITQFLGYEDSISNLVQFHPSYGYEEFVEGLRPTTEEGGLKFQVVPGILREVIENSKSSFPINITNSAAANSSKDLNSNLSNKYYFVAQGSSYEVAKHGRNIWAPNKNARGAEQVDWNLLKKLNIGDLIVHYSTNYIRAIGKVVDLPIKNTRRPYSGDDLKNRESTTYLSWENNDETLGTLVNVEYFELDNPVNKNQFCGEITVAENKRTEYSAFNKNGKISQKYLSNLSNDFINNLSDKFDEINSILKKHRNTNNKLPSPINEETKNSEHILLRFNPEWRDPASGTKKGVREYHQDVIDQNNFVWWGKYYVSRRIINSNKVQIYKEQLDKGISTYVYFLENKPGVKMYKSKLIDITEDFSKVEKQLIPKYYRDLAEDDCEVYFKIDRFEEVDRTQTIDNLRKASDPTKIDGVKIALTGSSSYLSVNLSYNEVIEEEISEKDSEVQDVEHFGSHDFLIIDEINRGNLPKIFGELLNTFEYRDENISLQYSDKSLSVPSNLIFLGTMNSTDKSVGRIDAAIRRRFDFIHVEPNYEVLHNFYQWNENHVPNLIQGLELLNAELEKKLGKHCLIGHTFFMKSNDRPFMYEDLAKIWDRKIFPLLAEYFLDDPNELETFNSFENFWPIEKKANAVKNNGKKYSLDVLASDLGEINKELELQFNKIVDWSRNYPEFNIYLGRRAVETFKTGGGTFIYQNNLQSAGGDERDNKYHFFRITGKGKFEIRLMDLYSNNFVRAPFDEPAFKEDFELRLKNLFEANNIDIDIDFFNKSLPGVPMESLVENQCIDQMLSFWDWVIENINKASSSNG